MGNDQRQRMLSSLLQLMRFSLMAADAAQSRKNNNSPAAPQLDTNASRLLPLEEVMTRCGICRTAVYARIKTGTFPAPAKVGASSRWLSTEIDTWIGAIMASRPTAGARTCPPKAWAGTFASLCSATSMPAHESLSPWLQYQILPSVARGALISRTNPRVPQSSASKYGYRSNSAPRIDSLVQSLSQPR